MPSQILAIPSDWYTWVFSGVGVTVAGFVVKRFFFKSEKPNASNSVTGSQGSSIISAPVQDSQVAVGSNINQNLQSQHFYFVSGVEEPLENSKPTPWELCKSVRQALPFDKVEVAKKYVGLEVTWRVHLSNMTRYEKYSTVSAEFRLNDYGQTSIAFSLLEVPADLRAANYHTPFWIRGVVDEVIDYWVYLKDDPEILAVEHP